MYGIPYKGQMETESRSTSKRVGRSHYLYAYGCTYVRENESAMHSAKK